MKRFEIKDSHLQTPSHRGAMGEGGPDACSACRDGGKP